MTEISLTTTTEPAITTDYAMNGQAVTQQASLEGGALFLFGLAFGAFFLKKRAAAAPAEAPKFEPSRP